MALHYAAGTKSFTVASELLAAGLLCCRGRRGGVWSRDPSIRVFVYEQQQVIKNGLNGIPIVHSYRSICRKEPSPLPPVSIRVNCSAVTHIVIVGSLNTQSLGNKSAASFQLVNDNQFHLFAVVNS